MLFKVPAACFARNAASIRTGKGAEILVVAIVFGPQAHHSQAVIITYVAQSRWMAGESVGYRPHEEAAPETPDKWQAALTSWALAVLRRAASRSHGINHAQLCKWPWTSLLVQLSSIRICQLDIISVLDSTPNLQKGGEWGGGGGGCILQSYFSRGPHWRFNHQACFSQDRQHCIGLDSDVGPIILTRAKQEGGCTRIAIMACDLRMPHSLSKSFFDDPILKKICKI